MPEAYIVEAVRTAGGRRGGRLAGVHPVDLAARSLDAIMERSGLEAKAVDDVVMGCVSQGGEQAMQVGRHAVLASKHLGEGVPAVTIDRQCGSSQQAIQFAAQAVMSGTQDVVIAAGVESMSRVIMGYDSGAWVADPAVALQNYYAPQGLGADMIATLEGYSREDVDSYAVESQLRAAKSWDEGNFDRSIVPVKDVMGEVVLDNDEYRRPATTLESLAGLKAAFPAFAKMGFGRVAKERYPEIEEINHVHTGGNSSGIVDGSGIVMLGDAEFGKAAGLKPRARIKGWASIGSDPTIMLTAPADVARKALKNVGMEKDDIDLYELNEAFASVVLRFMDHLGVDHDITNVAGGAIALGHPLGATGAMILGTVLDELERRDLNTAMTLLCAGNGLGTATIIERV